MVVLMSELFARKHQNMTPDTTLIPIHVTYLLLACCEKLPLLC